MLPFHSLTLQCCWTFDANGIKNVLKVLSKHWLFGVGIHFPHFLSQEPAKCFPQLRELFSWAVVPIGNLLEMKETGISVRVGLGLKSEARSPTTWPVPVVCFQTMQSTGHLKIIH